LDPPGLLRPPRIRLRLLHLVRSRRARFLRPQALRELGCWPPFPMRWQCQGSDCRGCLLGVGGYSDFQYTISGGCEAQAESTTEDGTGRCVFSRADVGDPSRLIMF
jgi:hypothetical protein